MSSKEQPSDDAGRHGIRQSVSKRKRRSKTLTHRERMLITCLSQGMSVTSAALKAGYSDQNPGQSGYQALKAIREKAPELLDRHGLTDDALIEKHLKPMLNATRTVFVKHQGKVTDEREVIAWGPRIASLDLVFRIRGMYKSKQENTAPNIKTVVTTENRSVVTREPGYLPPIRRLLLVRGILRAHCEADNEHANSQPAQKGHVRKSHSTNCPAIWWLRRDSPLFVARSLFISASTWKFASAV